MRRVFDWKRPIVWRRHIVALADDMINPMVLNVVRKAGIDHIVSDDSTWLDRAIRIAGKAITDDAFVVLAKRLSTHYTHIRVYHACRTTDTRSYYLRGLRALRRAELRQMAVRLKVMTGKDYVHVLRNLGRPTMFVCELPFSLITEHEGRQLSGIIVERLFEDILLGKPLDRRLSFPIASRNDISAACIKRHYHPDAIPDPHNHRAVYYWKGE